MFIDQFHFHPVAVEAADHFGQRPRIDDYDDFVHIVTFGMAGDGKHVAEVHCFITEHSIISVHHGDCPALGSVRDTIATHHSTDVAPPQVVVFYLIMDTLIDSFFPVLSDFDEAIDQLESAILKTPTEEQLGTLFDMKRQIMTIRKVIAPQRDMIASLNGGLVEIPGMTDKGTAYFRNLYDHLIRISDMVDSYRDLISSAMDTHLSMVSNRLNVVMKQLAVIATIFLPLGFLTGFFGQNFTWPLTHYPDGVPELRDPRTGLRAGGHRPAAHPVQASGLAGQRPHRLSRRRPRAVCGRAKAGPHAAETPAEQGFPEWSGPASIR